MLRSFQTLTLLVLLGHSGAAWAACTQLTAEGFQGFVDDAMSAIDDDDLVRHGGVFRSMQQQIPCLEGPVPIQPWSEFLVGFSVVEFFMGREWEPALDAALRVNPSVPRDFGPVEIRGYSSAVNLQPEDAPPLPDTAEFYVDGKPVTLEPELGKMHIVQRNMDGVWNSFLLMGEPWPEEWKAEQVEETAPGESESDAILRASVFALGGFVANGQSLAEPSDLLSDDSSAGALVGLGTFGDYGPGGPVGLFWDITGPLGLTSGIGNGMGIEAYAGPSVFLGPVSVNLGAGMTTVGILEAEEARLVIVPQPRVGARIVQNLVDGLDLDVGVGGGWAPPGWHGRMHAGVRGGGSVGWNAGLTASANGASLVENVPQGGVSATATTIRLGIRGGVSFGK